MIYKQLEFQVTILKTNNLYTVIWFQKNLILFAMLWVFKKKIDIILLSNNLTKSSNDFIFQHGEIIQDSMFKYPFLFHWKAFLYLKRFKKDIKT